MALFTIGFLSREHFASFAIQDAQPDRPRWPLGARGGDDCSGGVFGLNPFLGQIRCALIGRPANELDPVRLRLA
jgi:hypothetical protein